MDPKVVAEAEHVTQEGHHAAQMRPRFAR